VVVFLLKGLMALCKSSFNCGTGGNFKCAWICVDYYILGQRL